MKNKLFILTSIAALAISTGSLISRVCAADGISVNDTVSNQSVVKALIFPAGSITTTNPGSGSVTLTGLLTANGTSTFTNKTLTSPILTGGVNGGVLFTNNSGVITEDTATIYVDRTNKRLGIRGASPAYGISLSNGTVSSTANIQVALNGVTGVGSGDGSLIGLDSSGNLNINQQEKLSLIETVNGYPMVTQTKDRKLGIGKSSPAAALTVNGAQTFTAAITYSSATSTMACNDSPFVTIDSSGGNIMLLLPSIASCPGKFAFISRSSGSNTATLNGDTTETVNAAATATISGLNNGGVLYNVPGGTTWKFLRTGRY